MKSALLGALFGALLLLVYIAPVGAGPLHPRCNIDWPCAKSNVAKAIQVTRYSDDFEKSRQNETRRAARARQLEQAMPFGSPISPPETARSFLNAPSSFIRGRLVCARNIGAELARRGIQGTGSALAKSYLSWGRSSGPQPGAVAVFSRGRRGGHVAIVDSVKPDGTVIYLNPSSRRQAWQVGPYNRRPIAFRVAG